VESAAAKEKKNNNQTVRNNILEYEEVCSHHLVHYKT